jgi:ubiquitin conjugation factor E4 A
MLNYFLLQLCGPNQKRFKVQKREKYDFDPGKYFLKFNIFKLILFIFLGRTVREICHIYLNLKDCDQFCLAVTQDGRSYSPELFKYVETTLGNYFI